MLNSYYRLSVPEDLAAYYHITNVINNADREDYLDFTSQLSIKRDDRGRIVSVRYYSPDGDIAKESFYTGNIITKINYYRRKCLYKTEEYKDGLLSLKFLFKPGGHFAYSIEYEYNWKNLITAIHKKYSGKTISAEYKYDDIDRIVNRTILQNGKRILEQSYRYDILNRIVEYKDSNQRIVVNKVSKKNELISYIITDKMGNNIEVENHYAGVGYAYTEIKLNGHCSTIKDTNYVDNIMLKKPYTSEDDLDLIIANLFRKDEPMRSERICSAEKQSNNLIDKNIEFRVLPISMRKRLLYSITVK